MTLTSIERDYLTRAVSLAADAREHGNHPFGAILVSADGTTVEAENTVITTQDVTAHAETNLVRLTGSTSLVGATLYTSTEPCAMCCGAIFWAGIRRVVYALEASELNAMVPRESPEDTLDLPSREVFARGGASTEVLGPFDVPGTRDVHAGFWG